MNNFFVRLLLIELRNAGFEGAKYEENLEQIVVALIALRPVARRVTRKSLDTKTGVDRLVGAVGEVIEGHAPAGLIRVRVEREEWNAVLEDSREDASLLAIGSRIKVVAIDGTRLVVNLYEGSDSQVS